MTKRKLIISAVVNADTNAAFDGIPELSGLAFSTSRRLADSPELPSESDFQSIRFRNAPFFTWVYFDHEKSMDFVCVAIVALSGIANINFEISEDGMRVSFHYTWPTAIYRAAELFEKAINEKGKLSIQHPKVHAFVANALENGVSSHSIPKGEIIVDLPQKVQRIPSSWKKEAMTVNGTQIILLEFSAYQKSLIIDDADTSITF